MSSRKAEKQRRKQERQYGRKLVDKLRGTGRIKSVLGGKGIAFTATSRESMSDMLWSFVSPYEPTARSVEEIRKLLTVGMAVWNSTIVPEAHGKELLGDLLAAFPEDTEIRKNARVLINEMIERKLTHFPECRRLIISFELHDEPGSKPRLDVLSTLEVPREA